MRSFLTARTLGLALALTSSTCSGDDTSNRPSDVDVADTDDPTETTDTSVAPDLSAIDILDSQDSSPDDLASPDLTAPDDTHLPEVGTDAAEDPDVGRPDAPPLSAEAGAWTWIDEPNTACHDGSATGFGVNPSPSGSEDLLVFFMGGGACWDATTCYVVGSAIKGPFQAPQFELAKPALTGMLDRADTSNPYRDFNLVFIPYCTGDLHGGDRVATWGQGLASLTWSFTGAHNSALTLRRLAAHFFRPERLVITGASAGGYGASLNYARARALFRPAQSFLVVDSGPFLIGDAINPAMRSAWFSEWELQKILDEVGCDTCSADLSRLYPRLAALFPEDRMGLVSSLQDGVIATYFVMLGPVFELELRRLAMNVLANAPTWRWFLFPGTTHTTAASPGLFSVGDTSLWSWLEAQLDAPTWPSLSP